MMTDLPSWATEKAEQFCNENEPSTEAVARLIISAYQQGKQDGQRETREQDAKVVAGTSWYVRASTGHLRARTSEEYAAAIRRLDEVQDDA